MNDFEVVEGDEAIELEGSIFNPDRIIDLDALYRAGQQEDTRGAAYKVVATFSGLTKRRLWLKEGNFPRTDGYEILAPHKDPFFYRIVEHELAHILFQSSIEGKIQFIQLYCEGAQHGLTLQKRPMSERHLEHLRELLTVVIGILEDVRVESLWALLYPGSATEMRAMHKHMVKRFLKNANMSPATFLCVVSAGVKPPPGPYEYLRSAMEEAMLKVERRGFAATLAVTKWLMQQLIAATEVAKPDQREPSRAANLASAALERLKNRQSPEDRVVPDSGAPALARAKAVEELLKTMDIPSALFSWKDDVVATKAATPEEKKRGRELAEFVSKLDTKDATKMDAFLAASESKMTEVVEQARKNLGSDDGKNGWFTKNALGKVNLKDVKTDDGLELSPEDSATARKLKAMFYRVLGRRRFALHETGNEIDVTAYIESLVSKQVVPCFRTEERGRGFKVLVLVDRSGSMLGMKTEQAERACRTLETALRFPFVEFNVWGFQSYKMGEVDITRFKRGSMNFSDEGLKVAGATPLHHALRVAIRFMEQGSEAKQIIMLTDGAPSHATRTQNRFATKTLMTFARNEIRHARRQGVNVTGVVIGEEMKDEHLSFMFGPRASWQRMEAEKLGDGLVRAVSTSFVKYLHNG